MACASSILSEEQFRCSICLDVFTDPVTTPCGHNYCKACITRCWDTNSVYQCPLCQRIFSKRPVVFVNTFISEMVDQFRKSKQEVKAAYLSSNRESAKPEEVSCDACTEIKLKAVKSCLGCLTSYCETHLEPHLRVPALKRHKLIDPVVNLEDIMCKKHDRPLELFCNTDDTCVCQFCTELDHKSHRIVPLKEAWERKKAELGETEAEVQRMVQEREVKIQEVLRSVQLSKKDADKDIADSVQLFTALVSAVQKRQSELIDVIEIKQKIAERHADGVIKELEQEITELKKRSSELRRLSHAEDHLHFLQNFMRVKTHPPSKDWTKVSVHQPLHVIIVRTAVAQLLKTLSKEMKNLSQTELKTIQQYAVDVTLDPDTALSRLALSKDGKRVHCGDKKQDLRDNAQRFSVSPCVLGKQGYSSGRFYYEVQVTGKTAWDIGVATASIDRKKKIQLCPNEGYWTIWLRHGNEYKAMDDRTARLHVKERLQKVGVFVDYEEGLVSFYDVATRVHLYSFTGCDFTEKLYPYFGPCSSNSGKNSAPLIISPINKPK